jgi:short subunit dehydrogenase-like uncharacterized protein
VSKDLIIYGVTGYTGKLIAAEAKKRGLRPTLAGRNAEKVSAIAAQHSLPWAAFSVDDKHAVATALKGKKVLLSVAGPFSATAHQLMEAAIEAGVHYLDVTGEIAVFELAAKLGAKAKAAGVTLMPGVGFDVVPSDCLAAHTAARSKNPVSLRLAIKGLGGPSRGTAKTGVEALGGGTAVRRGGKITHVRAGNLIRDFDFGNGAEEYIGVSWGDVSTAYHSTSIGDIEVYFPHTGPMKSMTKMSRYFGPMMGLGFVQNFLNKQIDKMPEGPTDEQRAAAGSVLRAEVTDENGSVFISQLTTPNGYSLTADTAVTSAERMLKGGIEAGFKTPSLAFGANYINGFDGCRMEDH